MSNNRFAQKKRISLSFLRIPYLLFPVILIIFLLALSSIQDCRNSRKVWRQHWNGTSPTAML